MPHVCWEDPEIQHGNFRVYPRTDGTFAVVDLRRPLGRKTVKVFRTMKQAADAAAHWHQLGTDENHQESF